MKKFIAVSLSLVMMFTLFQSVIAQTEVKVTFNGTELLFDSNSVIINDRTMVPVRKIFETLGAVVSWDADMKKADAFINGKYIAFIIDQKFAFVDDDIEKLDSPAVILNDRTFVPLRFIIENLRMDNLTIDWNANEYIAEIEVSPFENIRGYDEFNGLKDA